jgi:50S ribosomal subunit-associated GTPase HflX
LFNEKHSKPIGFILPTIKQCKKVLSDIQSRLKGVMIVTFNKTDLIVYNTENDNKIMFLSAESGDSLRGNTFNNLIVDEACFISSVNYHANIGPTTAVSLSRKVGKLVLLSTPKTKN